MVAVKLQRRKNAETATLVVAVVNGGGAGARTLAVSKLSRAEAGEPPEVTLGDPEGDEWNLVWTAAASSGYLRKDFLTAKIIGLSIKLAIASAANEDGLSDQDRQVFVQLVKDIFKDPDRWDPTASRSPPPQKEPGLDTGQYDDGHAFGWNQGKMQGLKDAVDLASAPPDLVPDLVQRTYADAGVQPPLYRYSFSGLSATMDPGAGGLPTYTQTFSGTACGANPMAARWTLDIAITGGVPQPISGVDLSGSDPVTIVKHTTKQDDVEVGTATTTLRVVIGSSLREYMELNVTTTGTERVTTVVPTDEAITATQLAAGASC
jgi:hypothetical protein